MSLSRVSLSRMSLSRVSLSRVSPSRVLLYIELQTNDHEGTSHFTYHIQTVAFFLKVKRNAIYIWFDNKTNFITGKNCLPRKEQPNYICLIGLSLSFSVDACLNYFSVPTWLQAVLGTTALAVALIFLVCFVLFCMRLLG